MTKIEQMLKKSPKRYKYWVENTREKIECKGFFNYDIFWRTNCFIFAENEDVHEKVERLNKSKQTAATFILNIQCKFKPIL
ncbi:hypothetical protein FACS189430_02250 [Bacteroidia bacterium]|nr:hypothetical protein FACS189430_02250 [Bacteroidia bacterium]